MVLAKKAAQSLPATYHRLWLNRMWFIPVDDEGCVLGECAEGALGFVIKLHSESDPNSYQALKIPRLVGDTHRENAYISQLMEQELSAVEQVFDRQTGYEVPTVSLLHTGTRGTNLLRGPISTDPSHQQARDWNQAIVLVRFLKGEKPRFHLVKKLNDELLYYPPLKAEERPIKDGPALEQLASEHNWACTIFIEMAHGRTEPHSFPISQALNEHPTGVTWYTALPSINYGWAPQTLQETISRGLRGSWDLQKHLELIRIITLGLRALHTRGMLHADVRPANIVVAGDPRDPQSYLLSDYGSFALAGPQAYEHRSAVAPGTQLGPVVVGERASAFYAPERRLGREREASDTAIFVSDEGKPNQLIVLLGWRSDLIDSNGRPVAAVQHYIDEAHDTVFADDEFADTVLKKGDRVQIREYIFELVEDERRIDDKQVFTCKRPYWQIYHGRIAIEVSDDHKLDWMPIPRTVELLKWSVSTDLYSLGALALYSIFRHTLEQTQVASGASSDASQSDNAAQADPGTWQMNGNKVEEQFREMLTYLNSVPYFNAIWPELDWLRYRMEEELKDNKHNAASFAAAAFVRHDHDKGTAEDEQRAKPERKEPANLLEAAIDLTSRLTQTAPGVYDLVAALDFNLANFIFLMHFALSCMHRQAHLSRKVRETKNQTSWVMGLPFCTDRHEMPGESRAAKQALERIEYLKNVMGRPQLGAMVPDKRDEITQYDPRPDVSIRVDRDRLAGELRKTGEERDRISAERDRLLADLKIVSDEHDRLEAQLKKTGEERDLLASELKEASEESRRQQAELAELAAAKQTLAERSEALSQEILLTKEALLAEQTAHSAEKEALLAERVALSAEIAQARKQCDAEHRLVDELIGLNEQLDALRLQIDAIAFRETSLPDRVSGAQLREIRALLRPGDRRAAE